MNENEPNWPGQYAADPFPIVQPVLAKYKFADPPAAPPPQLLAMLQTHVHPPVYQRPPQQVPLGIETAFVPRVAQHNLVLHPNAPSWALRALVYGAEPGQQPLLGNLPGFKVVTWKILYSIPIPNGPPFILGAMPGHYGGQAGVLLTWMGPNDFPVPNNPNPMHVFPNNVQAVLITQFQNPDDVFDGTRAGNSAQSPGGTASTQATASARSPSSNFFAGALQVFFPKVWPTRVQVAKRHAFRNGEKARGGRSRRRCGLR